MRQPNGLILPINICAMISEKRLMKNNNLMMKIECPQNGHSIFCAVCTKKSENDCRKEKGGVTMCAKHNSTSYL